MYMHLDKMNLKIYLNTLKNMVLFFHFVDQFESAKLISKYFLIIIDETI